jgi:hypothetical protein
MRSCWFALLVFVCAAAIAAGAAATPPGAPYRPAPIPALIRPALPEEGVWRATAPQVAGGPPFLVTTFRSEPGATGIVAYVAWIDHTRTQLALYPGVSEPPHGPVLLPSQVPRGQRWRLLATFNGGFRFKSGAGGFAINGHTYSSLKHDLGTFIGYRDGHIDIVDWQAGPSPGPDLAFARQNLPLIVRAGRSNPNLADGRQWGATLGGAASVWRTGVGIDRHGNLIYAAAPCQTASTLARILIHAGAVRAIELDINPEWPTFDTYAHVGTLLPSKFVPNYQQRDNRYLTPDGRDFFAVYRRFKGEPAGVPVR